MYPLLNQKGGVEYIEKPVTRDEKNIAGILETIIQSLKNQDLPRFAGLFRDDAIIKIFKGQTQTERTITKKRYIDNVILPIIDKIRLIQFKNTLIRIENEKEAVAHFQRMIFYKHAPPLTSDGYIKFIRINAQWLIAEVCWRNNFSWKNALKLWV